MKSKTIICALLCGGILSIGASTFATFSKEITATYAEDSTKISFSQNDLKSIGSISYSDSQVATSGKLQQIDFVVKDSLTNIIPVKSDWNVNYRCNSAITFTHKNGSTVVQQAVLVKPEANKYTFIWGQWWSQYVPEEEDVVVINGTFTKESDPAFELTINNWTAVFRDGKFCDPNAVSSKYEISDSNVSLKLDQVNVATSPSAIYLNRNNDDPFPNRDGKLSKARFQTGDDTVTVKHSNGSTDTLRTSMFVYGNSYCFTVQDWANGPAFNKDYVFVEGDEITINGTMGGVEDLDSSYTLKINNLHIQVKDGKYYQDPSRWIELFKTQVAELVDNPTFNDEYCTKINNCINTLGKITGEERTNIDPSLISKVYTQYKDSLVWKYTNDGRVIHESTINTMDATNFVNAEKEVCVFHTNEIDFFYPVPQTKGEKDCTSWDHMYRSIKTQDSYFQTPNGTKEFKNSNIIFYLELLDSSDHTKGFKEGTWRSAFVMTSWSGCSFSSLVPGTRYVVSQTSYIVDSSNITYPTIGGETYHYGDDIYVVNFVGGDFMWTGSKWIDTKTAPHLVELINKIDAIGDVTYTPECKALIDDATNLLNSMDQTEKQFVDASIIDKLTNASNEYARLKTVKDAEDVVALIDAIGEVTYTPECKAKIDTAQQAYNALNSSAQQLVPAVKKEILDNAVATYNRLELETKRDQVEALIDAIGIPDGTPECKQRIIEARAAVDEYSKLGGDVPISKEKLDALAAAEEYYRQIESTDKFKQAISSLLQVNDPTSDEYYSLLSKAIRAYNDIPESLRGGVAAEKAQLETCIGTYNATINVVNDVHEESSNAAFVIIAGIASLTALGLIRVCLRKKGMF